VTAEEECYKEAQTEPLLQEKCASAQSCDTECSCALVTHSPFSPSASDASGGGGGDDNDKQGRPHRQTPQ